MFLKGTEKRGERKKEKKNKKNKKEEKNNKNNDDDNNDSQTDTWGKRRSKNWRNVSIRNQRNTKDYQLLLEFGRYWKGSS